MGKEQNKKTKEYVDGEVRNIVEGRFGMLRT